MKSAIFLGSKKTWDKWSKKLSSKGIKLLLIEPFKIEKIEENIRIIKNLRVEPYEAIGITSKTAVELLFENCLSFLERASSLGLSMIALGKGTAEELERFGFKAETLTEENSYSLLNILANKYRRSLLISSAHLEAEIPKDKIEWIPIYRLLEREEAHLELKELLEKGIENIVLSSSKSAEFLSNFLSKYNMKSNTLKIYAISKRVANSLDLEFINLEIKIYEGNKISEEFIEFISNNL